LRIFCYSVVPRYNITKVYADERINAEIKSLSILYVGGRGQPVLIGWSGGGRRKSQQIKKVRILHESDEEEEGVNLHVVRRQEQPTEGSPR
jgi:hypothetical protein